MDKDKKMIADLQDRLQLATQKINYQSNIIANQTSQFYNQNLQVNKMKQEILMLKEVVQEQEEQLKSEQQKNQNLTQELEMLHQKECQQEFPKQDTVLTWPKHQQWDTVVSRLDDQRWIEQEKVKKKNEFQILVKQQQSQNEQLLSKESVTEDRKEEQAERAQYEQKRHERLRVTEESIESKKQIQQELMEWSRNIRDMQRVIKDLYQFKPCRQLCELLINIRQNIFQNTEEIQEDLCYVAEAFGICEFEPNVKDCFDPKRHEQVHSNIQDIKGREIEKVYSSGFEVDGEVILKAQVSIR